MTPLVQEVMKLANKYKLNVIDLSKTFNPRFAGHYGTEEQERTDWSGAEPSNISNHLIAGLFIKITNVNLVLFYLEMYIWINHIN